MIIEQLDWKKMDNLIPAVIQDIDTLQVLVLGYVNQNSLKETLDGNKVVFYSRSKQRLWTKGEDSSNFLHPVKIIPDCDNDSILILVKADGPTCHLGADSCFMGSERTKLRFLEKLEEIIVQRYNDRPKGSYTTQLFDSGINRIAQKVGEESVETVIAALTDINKDSLINEAADLIYHLFVLLKIKGASFSEIIEVLKKQNEKSKQ